MRRWRATLLSAALLLLALPVLAAPTVETVGFTVSDLDREVAFFTTVLDFELVDQNELMGPEWEQLTGVFGARLRTARLRLGTETIELTEYLTPRGRPIPVDAKSTDRSFQHIAIVVSDMEQAYARIREHKVQHVSTAPQRLPDWNPGAGGIVAFYFQDADRHNLELIWYPAGKGDPRWQDRSRLFLGIDHTAIGIGSTDTSIAFYRDVVGLRHAGGGENWGTEQEHLNLVFGAHLKIDAMRGDAGPGVEFLNYLTPPGGRPMPGDVTSNDLVHWQTTIAVDDLDAAAARLRAARAPDVSGGIVALPAGVGFARALLARDPDGHAVRLVERRAQP